MKLDLEVCRAIAIRYGLPLQFVFKEFHLMDVISQIAALTILEPNSLVFKGGTALSKVYLQKMQRFSEDADFDLVTENARKDLPDFCKKFKQELVKGGLAAYGYENTKRALENNQAKTLIVNDELEIHEVRYKCNSCNIEIRRIEHGSTRQAKHDDGGTLEIVEEKDVIGDLIGIADKNGVETVFVSSESSYGKEFLMGFGGIGAILRYRI